MSKVQYTELTAWAHPSRYLGFDDSHVFVKASTGEEFCNGGGIYSESECIKVAQGKAYRSWLNAFMPNSSTSIANTGIEFGQNGVCHTYAMRELLFCTEEQSIVHAAGENLCLLYYGKYGCGLKYLEKRLRETYQEVSHEGISQNDLNNLIGRIYNTAEEETNGWVSAMKEYLEIDVISYFKSDNDWYYLRNRVQKLIDARERLFDQCFNEQSKTLDHSFKSKKKDLYITEFSDYMNFCARCGYFSQEKADEFINKFVAVLRGHDLYVLRMLQDIKD